MADKLKLAIVGCGNISRGYASTIQGHKDVLEIVGAMDAIPERAKALVAQYGGKFYATLDEVCADPEVDVVVNLTIHHAHPTVIAQCLNAGKHVYSEKPLALTYPEAKALVELAERKGLRLSCAPMTFMGEAQQTAWKAIRDGVCGTVRLVYAEVNHGRIEAWHPNPEPFYKVGPLFDVAVYPLTLMTTFFGPARRVTAFGKVLYSDRVTKEGRPFTIDTPDFSIAAVEFENGVVARLTTNFYVGSTKQRGLEFHGDKGTVHIGCFQEFSTPVSYAEFGKELQPIPYVREPFKGIEWARALVEMHEAMQEGRPQRVTGAQAAHVVEILCGITTSFTEGHPVDITSNFVRPTPMPWAL